MAYRDPLTGLGNRKAFDEQLGQALLRAGSGGSELALLYLDLDRFKEVNDRFGHDVGDALLKAVAERVRSTCDSRTRPTAWAATNSLCSSRTARRTIRSALQNACWRRWSNRSR